MKQLRKHTTFGHRRNPQEVSLEISATRAFGTVRKRGISLKTKAYRATHGEFHYASWRPNKVQLTGMVVIAIVIISILSLGNNSLFHSLVPNPNYHGNDPSTKIWQADGTNSGGEFALYNFAFENGGSPPLAGSLNIKSTVNTTSVALSKAQVGDLSIASGKTLGFNMSWIANGGSGCAKSSFCTQNTYFGSFLTINGTLPQQQNWTPFNDTSVAYIDAFRCIGTCESNVTNYNSVVNNRVWFLRTLGQRHTIQSESNSPFATDISCFTQSSSSCFFDTSFTGTMNGCLANCGTYDWNQNQIYLNYTGTTVSNPSSCVFVVPADPQGNGCSWMVNRFNTINAQDVNLGQAIRALPHFQFQAQQYYLGFFSLQTFKISSQTNFHSSNIRFSFHNPVSTQGLRAYLDIFTFNSGTAAATPPNIDTGGFFGPIIKALINLGIWIYSGFLLSIAVAAQLVQATGNALGNALGLGNVGTAMIQALGGVANFVANVLGTVFGWSVTLGTLFAGSIAVFGNFITGSFGFVGWIVSWFTALSGIWQIVQDFWTAVNTVVLSMNVILVFYYIIGMFMVYMDGWDGFKQWLEIGEVFTLKLVRLGWTISKDMTALVKDVKAIVVNWL